MGIVVPDLQCAVLCEDVRVEVTGQHTLVGVIAGIPAPALPVGIFKLCLWSRWGSGIGRFRHRSVIIACDDEEKVAEAETAFDLAALDHHATNVHVFPGIQFPKYGVYHVEILLDDALRLRFPLPVVFASGPPDGQRR